MNKMYMRFEGGPIDGQGLVPAFTTEFPVTITYSVVSGDKIVQHRYSALDGYEDEDGDVVQIYGHESAEINSEITIVP